MKKLLAGVLGLLPMGASAQDVVFTINPIAGTVEAEYFGDLVLLQMWSSISVRLTGDGPIDITSQNSVYTSILTPGGAQIAGNGANSVEFLGEAPGTLLGAPVDSSNPFSPFAFSYSGSYDEFEFELFGQNTVTFYMPPFHNPVNIINTSGPALLSWSVEIVPAPATAALLGFAGVVGARRRR